MNLRRGIDSKETVDRRRNGLSGPYREERAMIVGPRIEEARIRALYVAKA